MNTSMESVLPVLLLNSVYIYIYMIKHIYKHIYIYLYAVCFEQFLIKPSQQAIIRTNVDPHMEL